MSFPQSPEDGDVFERAGSIYKYSSEENAWYIYGRTLSDNAEISLSVDPLEIEEY